MSDENLAVELIGLDQLTPYARNPRMHSPSHVSQIAASITEFGWTQPILIDEENGIIAGHGRMAAAQQLGLGRVPVIRLDGLSEAQKRAYVIADNKLTDNSAFDLDLLRAELADLKDMDFDLALTGFSTGELADLIDPRLEEPQCDPDEIPEPAVEAYSKPGDLWICGNHRVMCGDSTSLDDVGLLLGGERADMVWTDPPYLMKFEGAIHSDGTKSKTGSSHAPIANDNLSRKDGERFLRDICSVIKTQCSGAFYVSFYRLGIEWIMRAMTDSGLKWRNLIIWKKNNHNLSNSDYKSIYEPLLFGWSDDYHPVLYGWNDEHLFRGEKGATDVMEVGVPSVWEIERTKKNSLHPTVKPVALVERSILNSSLPEKTVLDLFGGSGTTLIAAQMTGRHARLMELEPTYVDTICRRYYAFTGRLPIHAGTGAEFPIGRFSALPQQS